MTSRTRPVTAPTLDVLAAEVRREALLTEREALNHLMEHQPDERTWANYRRRDTIDRALRRMES